MRGRERVLAFLERYQLTFSRFVGYVTQPAYRDVLYTHGYRAATQATRKAAEPP